MSFFEMKRYLRLLAFLVVVVLVGTTLSCVQGELYGQSVSREDSSGWNQLIDKNILLDGSTTGEYMILQSNGYLVWNNKADGDQTFKVYVNPEDSYILLFYDYPNKFLQITSIDTNGVSLVSEDGLVCKYTISEAKGEDTSVFYKVFDNGVQMAFYIIDESKKLCQVGTGLNPAISTSIKGTVTIPSTINGYTVVKIADRAFKNCTGLTQVIIPSTVTEIGTDQFESAMGVFHGCSGITSFEIPTSVVSIGRGVFSSCTKITSIKIPESVTYIGSNAFDGCTNLISIELSPNISSILLETFRNCTSLSAIEIPSRVTTIGNNAFGGCTNLTTVTSLIKTPITIPQSAFSNYNATLYVPVGTKESYQSTASWNQFTKIIEIGTSENGEDNPNVEDGPINSNGGDGPNKASFSFEDKVLNTSYVNWYWAAPTDYPYDENHEYRDGTGYVASYDGHDYHILFSSYDTSKMMDAIYFNEGTFDMPSEITTITILWEEKKAEELPLGTYEGKQFSIHIWYERQSGSSYTSYSYSYTPDLNDFSPYLNAKMTIAKEGNDYILTISNLTLRGGPLDADGRGVDSKFYTNISFSYKGPLPKFADKYNNIIYY
jgi:hypothetical protein